MSVIQSGANLWVDGYTGFSGGNGGGAMGNSAVGSNPNVWGTTDSDSFTSVVSDVEEEGEVETTPEEHESDSSTVDTLSEEIEAGSDEFSSSNEIVAAVAAHIGIVEAAMRQHQATGTATFANDDAETGEDPADESFSDSLSGDMLQDPALAFAATTPSRDRLGILAMLQV